MIENKLFQESVTETAIRALRVIDERYTYNPDPENVLQFHDRDHNLRVGRVARGILSAICDADPNIVSFRDLLMAEFAGINHDRYIGWVVSSISVGDQEKLVMQRDIGTSEEKSAQEAIDEMDKTNNTKGVEIFTEEDKLATQQAILATVPGFDPNLGTVFQPNLTKDTTMVGWGVALGDLASAGVNPERYLKDGNNLFREEQIDVFRALLSGEPIDPYQIGFIRDRMITWSEFQITFARGRKQVMDQDISVLPIGAQKVLNRIFTKFEDSALAAAQIAKQRTRMDFPQLVESFGYNTDTRFLPHS